MVDRAEVLERKLRSDVARLKDLADVAIEHNTRHVRTLSEALHQKQARLAQLADLRATGYDEQQFDAFLTQEERKAFAAAETVLDPERIRLNLLFASLYLSAFEILRGSIIDHIEDFFVPVPDVVSNAEGIRAQCLDRYKREVGVGFSVFSSRKLIPSCRWLQKNGVLHCGEIDEIKGIREHRNTIAHQLPELIFSEELLAVDLDRLRRIRDLLRKIELFWIRLNMDIWTTGRSIDTEEIPDDEIVSGRETMLGVIINTVSDHLETYVQVGTERRYHADDS